MNKAITDGINFMPPAFVDGLDVWSDQDGTPGSTTYENASNATLIASDADFGACVELLKTQTTQRLRYMGEIPVLPGCYLRIRVRVKAMSGQMPSVRISGWAGGAGGVHITGVDETGSAQLLTEFGNVKVIEAIVGSGARTGVNMIWGREPIYGHFGLDLLGANGGVVRIEDITIEDVTSVFHRKMIDVVDVSDYGAIGNGFTDNTAAFEAADADSNGRDILVPEGVFYLAQTVTINNRIRFEGTVTMPDAAILQLTKNFSFSAYEEAFDDETEALRKAIQALFNFTDHDSLNLDGRIINLTEPLDVHAAIGNRDTFASRRVIQNGELRAAGTSTWDTDVVTATATYSTSNNRKLTNVQNIASIQQGSLVEGNGVGREVYVHKVDIPNNTLELTQSLYGPASSQTYTFSRFKYMLDFSGFTRLQRFVVDDINFKCQNKASGIMMAPDGLIFGIKDCYFVAAKDRCVTSSGTGCAGLMMDRNNFISSEEGTTVSQRKTIGFNTNGNDVKLRSNRGSRFKHWGVMSGTGNIISGNHFFQGEDQGGSDRTAGLVLAVKNCKTTITGNYVDNCYISWTNEHDDDVNKTSNAFGSLSITSNIFTGFETETWFSFLRIKPFGTNQYIDGLSVTGNTFKPFGSVIIDRVEEVDTSFGPLDTSKTRNVVFAQNQFSSVKYRSQSPVNVEISRTSNAQNWTEDLSGYLPFGLSAKHVTSVVPKGAIIGSGTVYSMPYAITELGADKASVRLNWPSSVRGTVRCEVRVDDPV